MQNQRELLMPKFSPKLCYNVIMKKLFFIFTVLFSLAACHTAHKTADNHCPQNRTLIIFYDAQVGKEPLFKAAQKYGSEILYDYKNLNGAAVRVPDNKTPAKAIKYYKRVPGVLSVEMDKRAYLM